MTTCTVRHVKALISKLHVGKRMLLVVVASKVVHMFALQFILNPLSIWCISNQRKDWANAFYKEGPLS